jgi:hypothetical protein
LPVLLMTKVRPISSVLVTVLLSGCQNNGRFHKPIHRKAGPIFGANLALRLGLGHDGKGLLPGQEEAQVGGRELHRLRRAGGQRDGIGRQRTGQGGRAADCQVKVSATLPVLVTVTSQVVGPVGSTVWLAGLMATLTPRSVTSAMATAVAPTPSWFSETAVRVIG